MKKILISLIIVCMAWGLAAQDAPSWKQELPRHDVYLGIGDPLVTGVLTGRFEFFSKCGGLFTKCSDDEYIPDWFALDSYSKGLIATPTISIGYQYRLAKWFWLGGTFSYTGFYEAKYERLSNLKCSSYNSHLISILPEARFSWLNKRIVTMYSSFGLGLAIYIDDTYYSDKFYTTKTRNYDETSYAPAFHLTAVGIHVGKKWYGFAELGFGYKGIIQAGFGYNFNSKKKSNQ